jgi:hypothetical protein
VSSAAPIPLTPEVRVERGRVVAAIEALRGAAGPSATEELGRLEALIRDAKPVPLGDDVRLDGSELREAMERLRAAVQSEAGASLPPRLANVLAAIDEVEDAVRARPAGFRGRTRVDAGRADDALDRLDAEGRLDLRRLDTDGALDRLDDLLQRGTPAGSRGRKVRVAPVLDALDRLRLLVAEHADQLVR